MPDNFSDLVICAASKVDFDVPTDRYECLGRHYQLYALWQISDIFQLTTPPLYGGFSVDQTILF